MDGISISRTEGSVDGMSLSRMVGAVDGMSVSGIVGGSNGIVGASVGSSSLSSVGFIINPLMDPLVPPSVLLFPPSTVTRSMNAGSRQNLPTFSTKMHSRPASQSVSTSHAFTQVSTIQDSSPRQFSSA